MQGARAGLKAANAKSELDIFKELMNRTDDCIDKSIDELIPTRTMHALTTIRWMSLLTGESGKG